MEHDKFKKVHEHTYRLVAAMIPLNNSVLDVGARNGVFRSYLNQHRYVGIDINPQNPNIIQMSGTRITLTERFDYVVCLNTLEHMDAVCALKSMKDRLKKDGKIIVVVPNAYSHRNLLRRLFFNRGGTKRTGHYYSFNVPDILNLFEDIGFINIKVQSFGVMVPKIDIFLKRKTPRGEHIMVVAQN